MMYSAPLSDEPDLAPVAGIRTDPRSRELECVSANASRANAREAFAAVEAAYSSRPSTVSTAMATPIRLSPAMMPDETGTV